jgi:hypothetical protein
MGCIKCSTSSERDSSGRPTTQNANTTGKAGGDVSPEGARGLGIIDTKLMNICLMVKWSWKLYAGEQGLWAEILRAKYLCQKDLLVDSHQLGSQFWNAIQKIKGVFTLGAKHTVRDGRFTRFWVDWWSDQTPFGVDSCPYMPSSGPDALVAGCRRGAGGISSFTAS